jgi:hypothetical protein
VNLESDSSQHEMDSQPILYLDVNIGNDDISRIIVMQSDDPIKVAEKFAKDNSKPSIH